jgi:hypothetical protein
MKTVITCRIVENIMSDLKSTSSPIQISHATTQAIPNAFTVEAVDLQLNPLDQEVFVVTGVKIDFLGILPSITLAPIGVQMPTERCSITTTRPTELMTMANSNVIAYADRQGIGSVVDYAGTPTLQTYFAMEQSPTETPDANTEYLAIIATSNFFVSVDSVNALHAVDVAVRVYGYRARASAATYAALVQSEVLSA